MRVLLVDDNPDDRFLIRRSIGRDDPRAVVVEAESGAHALCILQSQRFDLVVTDLAMPTSAIHGLDVAEAARERGAAVCVITGHTALAPRGLRVLEKDAVLLAGERVVPTIEAPTRPAHRRKVQLPVIFGVMLVVGAVAVLVLGGDGDARASAPAVQRAIVEHARQLHEGVVAAGAPRR